MRSFCQQLFKVWFKTFGRGEAKGASSGFEHVFLGEEDTTKEGKLTIAGFHNWIQFYFEERCGHLDYQGYILPKRRGRKSGDPPDGSESFLSVQFEWEGEMKPVSGMFVGVSPEFELALYSLLYYCGQDDNKMHLGDVDLNIRVNEAEGGALPLSTVAATSPPPRRCTGWIASGASRPHSPRPSLRSMPERSLFIRSSSAVDCRPYDRVPPGKPRSTGAARRRDAGWTPLSTAPDSRLRLPCLHAPALQRPAFSQRTQSILLLFYRSGPHAGSLPGALRSARALAPRPHTQSLS
jgi:hypothetical protein